MMHLFKMADLFPGRESGGEGPAVDGETNVAKERNTGIVRTPESAREGGQVIRWSGGGVEISVTMGGERLQLGENNEWEEGSYKSKELIGENVWG